MAEKTRKELEHQLRVAREEHQRIARENAMLRQELDYHQRRSLDDRRQRDLLSRDRDRLTATIEVLSRRIATDGPETLNYTAAAPKDLEPRRG